jgi:phytanoyl-CoA hydroxylase
LPIRSREHGLKRETFMAKRGDVLIWNADLAHGGSPISSEHSRKSVVTHYCTAEAVPSYFENRGGKKRIYRHKGAFYSSPHYAFDPNV